MDDVSMEQFQVEHISSSSDMDSYGARSKSVTYDMRILREWMDQQNITKYRVNLYYI